MKWGVYVHNFNRNKIEEYDIFKHETFVKYLMEDYRNCETKEQFLDRLKSELRYFFWSRTEWEVLIIPWIGKKEECCEKIDVFDQIMMNWHVFSEYVWNNIKSLVEVEDEH